MLPEDPLFWSFPAMTWLVSSLSFLVFALPLTLLAWLDPPSLRHRRIQGSRGKPQSWVLPGLGHWARNNAAVGVVTLEANTATTVPRTATTVPRTASTNATHDFREQG